MKLRDDVNEYGTPITVFRCEFCGGEFTVCPEVADDRLDQWRGCLAEDCASYDPSRDATIYFPADDPDLNDGPNPGDGFIRREFIP
jgi:hypothetical protein